MRIYVVRHSHPADADYDEDGDPDLDEEGVEIASALGAWMVEHEEIPTVIYASPMTRTTRTAELLRDAIAEGGFAAPEIVPDAGIGPHMSIKGLLEKVAADEASSRVAVVSHHESIEHGLRVLNEDPTVHHDVFAEGELRILRVKRKNAKWEERKRVAPSDLGLYDNY